MSAREAVALKPKDDAERVELLALFRQTATEVVETDLSHVCESTVLSSLAIDSLGMLEIIGSLERQLGIRIPDESLTGVVTLNDLLVVVEERVVTERAGAAATRT